MRLIDELDTQYALAAYLKNRRKTAKLSRDALAQKSGVPAPTIKRFETTAQISLRQFLKLWLCLDDMARLYDLTTVRSATDRLPTSIDEVLSRGF